MTADLDFPISRPVQLNELLHGKSQEITIDANESDRRALAAYLDTPEVKSLTARVTLRAEPGRVFRLEGTVKAEIVQSCVTTLMPVEETIDGPIRRVFRDSPPDDDDLEMDPFDDDTPDEIEAGMIDAGAVVCEHIALEMEPYPRHADAPAEHSPPSSEENDRQTRSDNPFAVLAQIRDLEK